MTTPPSAAVQYRRQQEIAALTAALMGRHWEQVGSEFDAGWVAIRSRMLATLQLGRAAAVHAAVPYTSAVLADTRQMAAPYGGIIPARFLEAEPSGMPVGTTLDAAPIKAKRAIAAGATRAEALAAAGKWVMGVGLTMLADTRRDVYHADLAQRPRVSGYVRMLNPPACPRCVILAGKRFLWNQGFQRHPRCDCIHIPASESVAGDLTTDPYAYFKGLSARDQDRSFGKTRAQAIRDGADIHKVVNISRGGMKTAGARSQMRNLEGIYSHDPNRRHVVENLQYHGWITGPQTAGGNILGNDPLARIMDVGRGRGTYSVGGQTVTTARAARYDAAMSGKRDPLNRSTMTAAERTFYDAHYRAQWARAGYRPNSVGANSADRGLGLKPITAEQASRAEEILRRELAAASGDLTPNSVRELLHILGY